MSCELNYPQKHINIPCSLFINNSILKKIKALEAEQPGRKTRKLEPSNVRSAFLGKEQKIFLRFAAELFFFFFFRSIMNL